MRATWYITEEGNAVDPAECSDLEGILTHSGGAKIAMRSADCPRSRGVDLGADGKLVTAAPHQEPAPTQAAAKEQQPAPAADKKTEEVVAEPAPKPARRQGYNTRQNRR
jgi:hypothetical protein